MILKDLDGDTLVVSNTLIEGVKEVDYIEIGIGETSTLSSAAVFLDKGDMRVLWNHLGILLGENK